MKFSGILALSFVCLPAGAAWSVAGSPGHPGSLILDAAQLIPPAALNCALVVLLALMVVWYWRERRLDSQRTAHGKLYSLGEQMTAGRPPSEGLKMLRAVLPDALKITEVRLYLHDRGSKTLLRLIEDGLPEPVPILTDDPIGLREQAVAACFGNRSLLAIPDTRRSPFFRGEGVPEHPRSAMFVPMFAQNDLVGVLEVDHAEKVRHFGQEEQAVVQHLANQFAIGMRLRERQSIQEQLLRGEKPVAAARLIACIAAELKAPLESIADSAQHLRAGSHGAPEDSALSAISSEARRASRLVTRLVSLASSDQAEAAAVDLTSLLRRLSDARKRIWDERKIRFQGFSSQEPLFVEATAQRLEQIFQSLLIHAESRSAETAGRLIGLRACRLGGNAVVQISYSNEASTDWPRPIEEDGDLGTGVPSLQTCEEFLKSCSGELRIASGPGQTGTFEAVLVAARMTEKPPAGGGAAAGSNTPLITLLVEPDPAAGRRLLTMIGDLGHRAVPASSADEAADLTQRLHFHVVFCAVHLPGMSCLELYDCVRERVDAFVLLREGYDSGLAPAFPDGAAYVVNKPVDRDALSAVLAAIVRRLSAGAR